ncbi:MAG: MFS transporter [Anaerolineae bacterium]
MSAVPASEAQTGQDKLDFKRVLPIFVIVLIDLLGVTIIIPLLPLYATAFGATPFMIGLLGAAYPMMQFLAAPILGRLSDRYGRKPILLISQVGTLLGFLLLGAAGSLWMLYLSRLIDGLSGANISTAQAAITDSTTEKTRTQGLGLVGAAFGIGFVLGPIIAFATLAVSGNDYRWPAFIAAAFSLTSIFLTWFLFKETLPADQRNKDSQRRSFSFGAMIEAVRHPSVGILLILIFFQQIAFGGLQQFLALFSLNRLGLDASGTAIIFVFVGVLVVLVQGFFIGRWSRRFGDRRLIIAGLGLLTIGLVMVALTPQQAVPWYSKAKLTQDMTAERRLAGETPPTQGIQVDVPSGEDSGWLGLAWVLLAMIPVSIGGGVLSPSINSRITKSVEPTEVGGILGISAAFVSGANAIAPVMGGLIWQALGPRWPFWIWGLIMGVLFVVAYVRLRPPRVAESTPRVV